MWRRFRSARVTSRGGGCNLALGCNVVFGCSVVVGCGLAVGCSEPGKVTVTFDWQPGERPEGERVALCASVREALDENAERSIEFGKVVLEPGDIRQSFSPPSLRYGQRYVFSARAVLVPEAAEEPACPDPVDYYGEVEITPDEGVELEAPMVPLCVGPGARQSPAFVVVGGDGAALPSEGGVTREPGVALDFWPRLAGAEWPATCRRPAPVTSIEIARNSEFEGFVAKRLDELVEMESGALRLEAWNLCSTLDACPDEDKAIYVRYLAHELGLRSAPHLVRIGLDRAPPAPVVTFEPSRISIGQVTATVDAGEALQGCPPVELGASPIVWRSIEPSPAAGAPLSTCRYRASIDDYLPPGQYPIDVRMTDLAGNRSTPPAGTLLVDNTPRLEDQPSLRLDAAHGSEWVDGNRSYFSFTDPLSDEPSRARLTLRLDQAPASTFTLHVYPEPLDGQCLSDETACGAAAGGLPFERVSTGFGTDCDLAKAGEPCALTYEHRFSEGARGDAPGDYCLAMQWQDGRGEPTGCTPLDVALTLHDPSVPTPDASAEGAGSAVANAIDFDQTVHHRAPWGSLASFGVATFSVVGRVDGDDVTHVIIRRPEANPSGAGPARLMGWAPVAPDRQFVVSLQHGDRDRLHLEAATVDRLGRRSAFEPIVHGEWTAALGAGDVGFAEPHEAFEWGSAQEALSPYDGAAIPGQRWAANGGRGVRTLARVDWRDVTPSVEEPAPTPRASHAMAYDTARGKVVMFGGRCAGDRLCSDGTWEWDGRRWLAAAPSSDSPPARAGHAMAFDSYRGRTLSFGGRESLDPSDDLWEWDGRRWEQRWPPQGEDIERGTEAPGARTDHALAYDPRRGVTWLFGGRDERDDARLGDLWTWDGSRWLELESSGPSPHARSQHVLSFDSTAGGLVLAGGMSSCDWEAPTCAELPDDVAVSQQRGRFRDHVFQDVWSLAASGWTRGENREQAGSSAAGVDVIEGPPLFFGGSHEEPDAEPPLALRPLAAAAGSEDMGSEENGPPCALMEHAMAFDAARRRVVVFGGFCSGPAASADEEQDLQSGPWEWDVASSRWVGPDSPNPRGVHALARDPETDEVVLFGGEDSDGLQSDTWTWDGLAWTERDAALPPGLTARAAHSLAPFDDPTGANRGAVLFGGYAQDGLAPADLWLWAGGRWSRLQADDGPSGPSAREFGTLAFAPGRGLLLYGGDEVTGGLWQWDGIWSPAATGACVAQLAPPSVATLAYHTASNHAVLVGASPPSDLSNAAWLWDGCWTGPFPAPDAFEPREGHTLVYDEDHHALVLFGGRNLDNAPLNDVWFLDVADARVSWIAAGRVGAAPRPSGRGSHAMAFVPEPRGGVLFGGLRGNDDLGDTWSWRIGAPAHTARFQLGTGFGAPSRLALDAGGGEIVLTRADVRGVAGGSGGAQLYAWAHSGWRALEGGLNSAEANQPTLVEASLIGPGPLRGAISGGKLHVAVRPRQRSGGLPELMTTYLEVVIAYRLEAQRD